MFTHRPLVTIAFTFAAILLIIACSNTTETTEDTTSVPAPTIDPRISSVQDSPTLAPTLQDSPTSIPIQEGGNPSDVDILEDRPTDIFEETEVSSTFEVAGETKAVVIESRSDGSVIKEGEVIKTGATEEITTDITVDGTTRMMRTSPDTEWTVGDAEETGAVVIELTRGEIKIVDDGFGYFPMQVDTPTGSVLLRGTWVSVRVLGDGSTEVDCVKGPCQYLDENSRSVVMVDEGTVRDTTDADPSTGEMTEEEVVEFESIPEIQTNDLQDTYNEKDPEEYEQFIAAISSFGIVAGDSWSPPYATYSGTVIVDGEDAPEGIEVRFRVPTADDTAESVTFATDTVGSRGRFRTNVYSSVSDSPLKLSDGDLLAVEVVTPDGTSESHLIEWSKGRSQNGIRLNVRTNRPIPKSTPTPTPTPQPTPTNTPVPTPTLGPVALPAIASNVIPHVFVGGVTVNGQVASDGAEVSAWVSEFRSPVGKGTVSDGSYVMNVSQYGIASFAGKTLTFKIDGVDTMQTATWATGGATVLDLAGD